MQRVEKVLERVSELPFSPVVIKILELAQEDRAGAREIAKLIAQDQAFTARLLKIANSPYYGQTRPVTRRFPCSASTPSLPSLWPSTALLSTYPTTARF